MKALLAELDGANLSSPIPWATAHKLPYLDSCIKEALRMTPAIGIPLERVSPPQGMEISGRHFEPGTVLGVNAWVVHKSEDIFGADAALWRPGRWIEANEEKKKEMERTLFAVSSGATQLAVALSSILIPIFISLEAGLEFASGKISRIWRRTRSFLNCLSDSKYVQVTFVNPIFSLVSLGNMQMT
jgi:hypothetical protein